MVRHPTGIPLNRRAQHIQVPLYGQQAQESGSFDYDDKYYEQEDSDLEDEIDRLEEEQDSEDDEEGYQFTSMSEVWPSAVPNRLGQGYTNADGVRRELDDPDDPRLSSLGLQLSLPYEVETVVEMDDKLDLICNKLIECIHAREFGMGFRVWDSALSIWMTMGYPMKRDVKIRLIFMFYEVIFVPGLSASSIEDAANQFIALASDRNLTVNDIRIPWRPLYSALHDELFPHPNRLARHSINIAPTLLNVAEEAQRFFHPADVDDMLEAIVPEWQPSMDSILATQAFLVHFLPISHCQKWLPLVFRLWGGYNSGLWDDQASDLMGQLAIAHIDPRRSDPSVLDKIPRTPQNTPDEEAKNPNLKRQARHHLMRLLEVEGKVDEDPDGLTYWAKESLLLPEVSLADPEWRGIRKDVGIFTDEQFEFLMSKCLRSLNVPVGGNVASQNSMSVTVSDTRASKKVMDAKKPIDRVQSLAETIVFSMSEDSLPLGSASGASTPGTGGASAANTPAGKGPLGKVLAQEGSTMPRRYVAGCKALDHLSRLLTSCETFFHPSNSGHWSSFLTTFLTHLSSNFLERLVSESQPSCHTPSAWRLTHAIRREFVLVLRPLALTAMFQKDMKAVASAVSCLKKLGVIEPDLIMPALLERAVPSLQGLEETQRTPAVIYALAALAEPLAARQLWRSGGLFIPDIFELLLPGIDLNDPSKSALVSMCISNTVDFIHMSDISDISPSTLDGSSGRAVRLIPREHTADDPNDPLSTPSEPDAVPLTEDEIEARLRFGTASFRDWVPEFVGRVVLLFGNLPEEGGKTGRAGGKTEQVTLQSVLHTCGGVFNSLSPPLFSSALDQIVEYLTTTTRSNAVDAAGELVRNLASANAPLVFDRLFPIAKHRIESEIKSGASSVRTNVTSVPVPGDACLHWWQSILVGTLIPGRVSLSDPVVRKDFLDLLRTMIAHTYSERGWAWTGKILEKTISSLTSIYFREMKFLNPAEIDSPDFRQNHTSYWGKLYRPSEVVPQWRMPSQDDLNMAFDIIQIADEARGKIDELIRGGNYGDKVWSNEFCRAVNVLDKILRGSYNLFLEIENRKLGGKVATSYLPKDLTAHLPSYKSGVCLTDPSDPRYILVENFRQRTGETLHRAATALRVAGQSDSSVDAVKLLVTTISTYMTAYGVRSKQFSRAQSALTGMTQTKKLVESQRKHHRTIYLASASIHHQTRLTTLAYYRKRSELDDKLILSTLDLCLSPFVRVRRSAQTTLDTMAKLYRGVWVLCFPTLFDALKPGTDPDIMKGALYVLRYNHVGINRIGKDWRQLLELTEMLLGAHHENKASVQALVSKATDELIGRIREPISFDMDVHLEKVKAAATDVATMLYNKPDPTLIEAVHQGTVERLQRQDQEWDVFVSRVLSIAKDPSLNWRYVLSAARFLLAVVRRDKPVDLRLVHFFMSNVQNPLPRIRDYGIVGTTRLLFLMTVRSLCQGDERLLFLQEPIDKLSKEIPLIDTSTAFTEQYLASFRSSSPEIKEAEVILQDRMQSGWLVWGNSMEVSRFTGWDERGFEIEDASLEGKKMYAQYMSGEGWWKQLADLWAQESERNYPSATHIDFILALSQIYGISILHYTKPIIESYLSEMEATKVYDRHKTRAMFELLSGMLKGGTEWKGQERKEFWDWFTPRLPELYGNIRHDTTKCWDTSIEYVICDQDPRRFQPIIDFCIATALNADFQGASAFDLTRSVQLVRSVIRCLRWRFHAWADDFAELYFGELASPYAEVRSLIASVLNAIDQLKFHPSYPSASTLTSEILNDPTDTKDIMHIRSAVYQPQLGKIMFSLPELKKDRPHGPKAVMSDHDNTAMTVILWLSVELSDVHAVAAFPYIIPILPQIFELRELNDNIDLQRNCGRLLAMITSITPALDLIEPLMASLISILQGSTSWRTRMNVMPVLSLVYFRNLALLSEACKAQSLDVVSTCLKDLNQEVREMASATLSGFLRCSQRSMIVVLKDKFTKEIQSIVLPKRRGTPGQANSDYQEKLVQLHGAVLGATALVEAFPYTVPKFIPKLLADVLAPRVSEPAPISTTIRSCVASFKRTHEKYQDKFSEDELSAVNYAQAGNSYYV